jgi:hypothetical protein
MAINLSLIQRADGQRVVEMERRQTDVEREDETGNRTFSRTKYAVSPCVENKRREATNARTSSCSEPKRERRGRVGRSRLPLRMYRNVLNKMGQ